MLKYVDRCISRKMLKNIFMGEKIDGMEKAKPKEQSRVNL